ncbi:hypothetical protein [Pseudomonas aeruginosa]|uniref:hypothetical protein n=1 Tax=Pseudomonas aeruginosa TaxID=287 RepID=UPI00376F8B9F
MAFVTGRLVNMGLQFLLVGMLIGGAATFFSILFLFSFSPDIEGAITPSMLSFLKDIVGPVAAGFGGAIAGAYAAYFLSRSEALRVKAEKEAEENRLREIQEVQEINVALVNLMAKLNDIWTIKVSYFDPWANNPLRFLLIPPFTMPVKVPERLPNSTVAKVACLGLKDATNILYKADEGYYSILDNLLVRGGALKEIRDLLSERACTGDLCLQDYKVFAGAGRLVALYINTEELIKLIRDISSDLIDSISALADMAVCKYKGLGVPIITHDVISDGKFEMPAPYYKSPDDLKSVLEGPSALG